MTRLAVIIPSRQITNLVPCVDALRKNEPTLPVIVVSDGLDLDQFDPVWYRQSQPLQFIDGEEPFVFARNVNVGIRLAHSRFTPDAYVLLNDDALLLTPGGLTRMARSVEEHPGYGVISAVTNVVGNPAQQPRCTGFRDEPNMLCFVCVLITAATLETVGELDERFTAYGWEDNDYCRRCRLAGIRLGIYDLCYVDHAALHSTFRGDPYAPGNIAEGAAIYRAKWGSLT
jgi:GT2 family glycosyltransferase